MPQMKFTKNSVDMLPFASDGQVLYRDTAQKGLGLRVGKSAKVYFAEGQVNRRSKRVSLGRADLMAPEIARKAARLALSVMADGSIGERKTKIPTVAEAFEDFLREKPALAPCTKDSYRRSSDLYLSKWRARRLDELDRSEILIKHRKISEKYGKVTANNVFRHLRSIYNYTSVKREGLPPNPVTILTRARAWNPERRRRRVVKRSDFRR